MSRLEINIASGWNERMHVTLSTVLFLTKCHWRVTYWDEWEEEEEALGLEGWVVWGTLFSSFDRMYCVMSSCQERPARAHTHTHTHTQSLVQDRGRFSEVNSVSQRSWSGFLRVFIECPRGQHNGKVKVLYDFNNTQFMVTLMLTYSRRPTDYLSWSPGGNSKKRFQYVPW